MTEITRETKELTTPGDHKIVVYDYISGGELRQIQALFVEDMSASDIVPDEESKETPLDKVKASTMLKAQELAIELLVVSVDGETGNGWELVSNLRPVEMDYVITEIDKYVTTAEGKKK